MRRLNYCSFEEIIRGYFREKIRIQDLVMMLLSAAFVNEINEDLDTIENGSYSGYHTGKKEISYRIRKHYLDTAETKNNVKVHFEVVVIPFLITEYSRVDDMLDRFCELISEDDSILAGRKEALLALATPDTLSDFLAETFVYAVRQNNKIEKQEYGTPSKPPADGDNERRKPRPYITRATGSNEDYDKAVQLFEQGDARAVQYFKSAANDNDAYAMAFLGYMYSKGDYVEQDYSTAVKWWTKAVSTSQIPFATNDHSARGFIEFNLGYCYYHGQGVVQDYSRAHEHYLLSAEGGNLLAAQIVGDLFRDGIGTVQDYKQAARWYTKVAMGEIDKLDEADFLEHYIGEAQYQLALLYKNGQGVIQNRAKASEWLTRAASHGHSGAKVELELLEAFGDID